MVFNLTVGGTCQYDSGLVDSQLIMLDDTVLSESFLTHLILVIRSYKIIYLGG